MNLATIIDAHPEGQVALVSHGRETTYGELRTATAALRAEFAALGVGPGHVVALLCSNTPYFVISYLSAVGVGAVAAPLNPTSPAPEIEREMAVLKPTVVVVEPAAMAAWQQVSATVRASVRAVMATEGHEIDGVHTIDEVLESGGSSPVVDIDSSTPAAYLFTSGTAGSPKVAMLSHGNLMASIDQSLESEHISADDVILGVLPSYHIFGLNVMLCATLAGGARVVLVQRFDPVSALETIETRAITVVMGAPSMWMAFSQIMDEHPGAFRTVRLAVSGAAKLPEKTAHLLVEKYGLQVAEGYGLTEASPGVTNAIDLPFTPGSIGRPLKGVEVRVVDENGEDSLVGDPGEIWVRGPNVFLGYLDDPEATARVLTPDGWLRTGDIAVVDEHGNLFMVDRIKDIVIVSGFNVYPGEVEDVLRTHPAVADAAVIGTPHPHTGEAVRAYVVLKPGSHLDEDAVVDHCRRNLARYKSPSKVLFVPELPRNVSGKLQRYSLR